MSRRIDKETAHRRAAAPSIDFSLLPNRPDLDDLVDQADRPAPRSDAPRATDEGAAAPSEAAAPPEAAQRDDRTPYRGRDPHGRTLQPFDLPEPHAATPTAGPARDARPAGSTEGSSAAQSTSPPTTGVRQSQIPTLILDLADRPAPGQTLDLDVPPGLAAHASRPRAGGPTLTLPPEDLPDDLRELPQAAQSTSPAPRADAASSSPEARPSRANTPPLPPAPALPGTQRHRAQVGRPRSEHGDRAEPSFSASSVADPSAKPRTDRFATLVSQPPDAAFFAASAPIDHDEIDEQIATWERRRWARQLWAMVVVGGLMLGLIAVAVVAFSMLYLETSTSPLLP